MVREHLVVAQCHKDCYFFLKRRALTEILHILSLILLLYYVSKYY